MNSRPILNTVMVWYFLTLSFCCIAYAGQPTEGYVLTRDYLESLRILQPVMTKLEKIVSASHILSSEEAPSLAKELEELKIALAKASLKLDPFTKTKNKGIRESAVWILNNYKDFAVKNEETLSQLHNFLRNPAGTEENFRPIDNKIFGDIAHFDEYLFHGSYQIVDSIIKHHVTFSKEEREDLVKQLKEIFGEKIVQLEGMWFRNTGPPLYDFLIKETKTN